MDTFAYTAHSFGLRLARLAGAPPATCPPTTAETFDLSLLAGRDFVWFKLHGRQGAALWYGDHWTTALSASRLAQADLSGAVVFVSNCWLLDDSGVPGPMLAALAQADAHAIIGGPGTNYAGLNHLAGTDLLGLYVRFFLQLGFTAQNAFRFARVRLNWHRPDKATEDTLAFQLWQPHPYRATPGDLRAKTTTTPPPTPDHPRTAQELHKLGLSNVQTFKPANAQTEKPK
jgi:hypothetical protein